MNVIILCSYPTYRYANDLGLPKQSVQRITTWNESLVDAMAIRNDINLTIITGCNSLKTTKQIQDKNKRIIYLSMPRLVNSLTLYQYTVFRANRIIKQLKPDVVHGIGTEHIWPSIAVRSKYPSIITIHGVLTEIVKKSPPNFFTKRKLFSFLEPRVVTKSNHLISINQYVTSSLSNYITGTVHNIENPINNIFFDQNLSCSNDDLIFIGGIEPLKGLTVLLKALSILKNKHSYKGTLHIVGPSNNVIHLQDIQSLIKELNLSDNIIFHGFLLPHQIASLFKKVALLAVPSYEESFSMTCAEAMASGLPVVASNVGGIPNVVSDGVSGRLVDVGDEISLCNAIHEIISNRALRKKLGIAGKKIAENRWRPSKIADKTINAYKSVLVEKRSPCL